MFIAQFPNVSPKYSGCAPLRPHYASLALFSGMFHHFKIHFMHLGIQTMWTRLDPKWFCRFRFAVFIFALSAVGCNSSYNASANVSRIPKSVFFPGGDPKRCPDRCLSGGMAFARAALCLDPTEEKGRRLTDADQLLGVLKTESESTGSSIVSVPLEGLLDQLPVGPAQPALLVDEHGHLHLLLGKIDVDGQFFSRSHMAVLLLGSSLRLRY